MLKIKIQIPVLILKDKTKEESLDLLKKKVSGLLSCPLENIFDLEILKKSIDARKKPEIFYVFSLGFSVKDEKRYLKRRIKGLEIYQGDRFPGRFWDDSTKSSQESEVKLNQNLKKQTRPVVVGFGPAGIGSAYVLAKRGLKPIIIERGSRVDERVLKVESFWNGGPLDKNTNVQFGEGGAGAFSDGKLSTGNKDKDGLKRAILKTLVKYGAPENIVYDALPHVGTDLLRGVVKKLRLVIEDMGGEFLFDTTVTGIETKETRDGRCVTGVLVSGKLGREPVPLVNNISTDTVILAIGHSARDTFGMLTDLGVSLTPKPFAVGYRVVHSQDFIDETQYGPGYGNKGLRPSSYKLTYTAKSGTPVYSFCMCPGGYVVNSSSSNGGLCVNGMSYSKRDGLYANSAVVMGVNLSNGIEFQEELERKAFEVAGGKIPYCRLNGSEPLPGNVKFIPDKAFKGEFSEVSNLVSDNLILPQNLNLDFKEAMSAFSKYIPGFNENTLAVAGVESRTSSPVRIVRDENYESVSLKGLYPAGEGAGYAGGIMSAAMDGVRIANQILTSASSV